MVNMRDELRDIRIMQNPVYTATKTIEDNVKNVVKYVSDKRNTASTNPSKFYMQWSEMQKKQAKDVEDAYRYGIEVTTNRYEDAIAILGGKVNILETANAELMGSLESLGGAINTLGAGMGAAGGLGMLKTVGVIAGLAVVGIIAIKVID